MTRGRVYSDGTMKNRRAGFCGLALWLGLLAIGGGMASGASAVSTNRHSLWKATGPHCSVYLLGSIHFLKPENYPLAEPIERAFTNAQIVAFETDIGVMEQPTAILDKFMAKAMLPAGETLKDQLSAATYLALSNYVAGVGLPMEMFSSFKPGMAAMTVEATELQRLGFQADQGVDLHFYRLAVKQDKKVIPLETVDFQLDLITGFSKEEGEVMVKSTLDEIETTRKVIGDIIAAWQAGDASGTEKLLNAEMLKATRQEAPALYRRLLTDRNRSWLPKIEELLAGNTNAIVIVGAGHLVGKEGLVGLLKKKGVKIVQE